MVLQSIQLGVQRLGLLERSLSIDYQAFGGGCGVWGCWGLVTKKLQSQA